MDAFSEDEVAARPIEANELIAAARRLGWSRWCPASARGSNRALLDHVPHVELREEFLVDVVQKVGINRRGGVGFDKGFMRLHEAFLCPEDSNNQDYPTKRRRGRSAPVLELQSDFLIEEEIYIDDQDQDQGL